MLKTEQNC